MIITKKGGLRRSPPFFLLLTLLFKYLHYFLYLPPHSLMRLQDVHQQIESHLQLTKYIDNESEVSEDILGNLIEKFQDEIISCFEHDYGKDFLTPAKIESLLDWHVLNYRTDLEYFFGNLGIGRVEKVKFSSAIDEYLATPASPELIRLTQQLRQRMYN